MAKRRVLVVGGGIAGMSFAIAARNQGLDVELVELEPRVTGVGIFLTGSTLNALESIGVAHECARQGWPADSLRLFDGAGNFLADNPLTRGASPDLPISTGIPRPALAKILYEAAEDVGAQIRVGLTVDALAQDEAGVDVVFSDGTTGRFDAVIGADGIYSHMRKLVFGSDLHPEPAGQGGWRFMTPRHEEVEGMMIYAVDGRKAAFVPLNRDWMYVLCTMSDPDGIWVEPEDGPKLFRELLEPFEAPLMKEMCERLRTADPAMVWWRPFETLLLEDSWSRGRVVLIGDAAHSMTPHLSSGGGMAIEDAVVLATCLATDLPVEEALREFYERRIARVRKVQGISHAICREEISPNPSSERIYALTREGYNALGSSFASSPSYAEA